MTRLGLDPAGRLVAEHGANGTVAYELDELDTLEALQLPHGQRLAFASYGSGHVHRIAAGGEVVTDIERDDLHREVLRTQGLFSERTFDAKNRLMKVVTKNGRGEIEATFEYDALGRRIGKTEKTTEAWGTRSHQESVRFVWQGLRLVQEIDPHYVRSYVYSPDAAYTPLARLDVTNIDEVPPDFRTQAMLRPRMLHFHTDQIGTPQEVTDQDGELLWSGQYDAWGKVRRDGTAPRIEQPLRFAGQYADAGTGLHYNTFRYYDPDVGRFISQDPIGLMGGANLYAYAPNPIGWMDPWGLAVVDAIFQMAGQTFAGTNPTERIPRVSGPTVPGLSAVNSDRFSMHAEIDAMMQAHDAGLRGGTGTLTVEGKPICMFCKTSIKNMAKNLGLDEFVVHEKATGKTYTWRGSELNAVREGGKGFRSC